MIIIQWFFWIVELSLQVSLLSAQIRGPYKNYPFVFAYALTLFFTQIIEIAAILDVGRLAGSAVRYYWIDDALRQALIFCVVVSLIHRSMGDDARRKTVRRMLFTGALLLTLISLQFHRDADISIWMTKVSRDLNFTAAVLNLLLWGILLASPAKDRQILMISGALGIQFTGAAIGHSIRQLAWRRWRTTAIIATYFIVACHQVCLYLWWKTFSQTHDEREKTPALEPEKTQAHSGPASGPLH